MQTQRVGNDRPLLLLKTIYAKSSSMAASTLHNHIDTQNSKAKDLHPLDKNQYQNHLEGQQN